VNIVTPVGHQLLTDPSELIDNGLFFSRYPQWKRVRALQNPSFTTGKLKSVKPMIEKIVDQMCAKLEPIASGVKVVDMRLYYDSFMFDVISTVTTGANAQAIQNPRNNPLFDAVKNIFQKDQEIRDWIVFFLPFMRRFMKITFFDEKDLTLIARSIRQVIDERMDKNIVVPDLLQNLIDTSVLAHNPHNINNNNHINNDNKNSFDSKYIYIYYLIAKLNV